MKLNSFSKKEAFLFGWNTTKANFKFLTIILITLLTLNIASSIIRTIANQRTITIDQLSTLTDTPYHLFEDLINNKYIDKNGIFLQEFVVLRSDDELKIAPEYLSRKTEIYTKLQSINNEMPLEKTILYILLIPFWVISILTSIGAIKIALKLYNGQKPDFFDLFNNFSLFFKYLFSSIVYGLIVFGGMLLLVIPGIIWLLKFYFFNYLIVDKNLTPITALKQSAHITNGAKKELFVFSLVLGLLNLAGALCLIVGLLITIPISMLAMTFVYKKLLLKAEQNNPVSVEM